MSKLIDKFVDNKDGTISIRFKDDLIGHHEYKFGRTGNNELGTNKKFASVLTRIFKGLPLSAFLFHSKDITSDTGSIYNPVPVSEKEIKRCLASNENVKIKLMPLNIRVNNGITARLNNGEFLYKVYTSIGKVLPFKQTTVSAQKEKTKHLPQPQRSFACSETEPSDDFIHIEGVYGDNKGVLWLVGTINPVQALKRCVDGYMSHNTMTYREEGKMVSLESVFVAESNEEVSLISHDTYGKLTRIDLDKYLDMKEKDLANIHLMDGYFVDLTVK